MGTVSPRLEGKIFGMLVLDRRISSWLENAPIALETQLLEKPQEDRAFTHVHNSLSPRTISALVSHIAIRLQCGMNDWCNASFMPSIPSARLYSICRKGHTVRKTTFATLLTRGCSKGERLDGKQIHSILPTFGYLDLMEGLEMEATIEPKLQLKLHCPAA